MLNVSADTVFAVLNISADTVLAVLNVSVDTVLAELIIICPEAAALIVAQAASMT